MEPDKFEALAKDPAFIKAAKALVVNRQRFGDAIPMEHADPKAKIPFSEADIVKKYSDGKYSRGDVDAWLRQAADPSVQNILEKMGQGATFNFIDELRGVAKGKTARDATRLQENAFSEQHPASAGGAEIGGGLLNPANLALMAATGGASEAAPGVIPALLKHLGLGALIGGGEGAMYGLGEGVTPEDRAARAKEGAVGGAVAGVVPAAAMGGASLVRGLLRGPEARAAASVARAVRAAGGKAPLMEAANAQEAAGLDPVLGDLPGMEGAHDVAATFDPATKAASDEVAAGRAGKVPLKIGNALITALPPGVGTDIGSTLDVMANARRAKFDPAYAALGDAQAAAGGTGAPDAVLGHQPTVGEIAADPTHPQHSKALALAANGAETQRMPMPGVAAVPPDPEYAGFAQMLKQDPKHFGAAWKQVLSDHAAGGEAGIGRPTVDMLRAMRTNLQDDAEALFREGRSNAALALKDRIQAVNGVLDSETGGAGQSVDAAYRAQMDAERAVMDGRAWYNSQTVDGGTPTSITGLKAKLSTMTPEELKAFRTGVASSIKADLEHSATNRNVAKELLDSSPYRKTLLRSVFDNGQQMNDFLGQVEQMAQQAKLARAGGGSATAGRMAAGEQAGPAVGMSDLTNPVGLVGKAAQSVAMGVGPTAKQQFGAAVGKLTMKLGTPSIDDALTKMLAPGQANIIDQFFASPAAGGAAAGVAASSTAP